MTDEEIHDAMTADRNLTPEELQSSSAPRLEMFLTACIERAALQYMAWCKRQLNAMQLTEPEPENGESQ